MKKWNSSRFRGQMALQFMVFPGLILLIIFSYLPMMGIVAAFQNYNIKLGFLRSPWVGLEHFRTFISSRDFAVVIKNTVVISFAKLLLGFPTPIILALFINEVRNKAFKRTVQTITYLPYFLSWVIVTSMVFSLLNTENGSINMLLMKLGVIDEPTSWMTKRNMFLPILLTANVWKNVGYSSIIYLAAIAGVNPEFYEAAAIDGASRFKQTMVITLPSIASQIIILLILDISNILNAGFDDIYMLTNSLKNGILIPVANVIDTHVYDMGVVTQRYSYATAVGLFKAVINLTMLVIANEASRRFTETSLW